MPDCPFLRSLLGNLGCYWNYDYLSDPEIPSTNPLDNYDLLGLMSYGKYERFNRKMSEVIAETQRSTL